MIYLLLALLTYAAAVFETTQVLGLVQLDCFGLLAAIVLVTQRFESAIVWLTILGLTVGVIGTVALLGLHAVCFVAAGFAVRIAFSKLHERPIHVACMAGLTFLIAASGLIFVGSPQPGSASPDWFERAMVIATTWLGMTIAIGCVRLSSWLLRRFRKRVAGGGAMGTPVGLSVH